MKNKRLKIIGGIVLLLAILNPTPSDFKNRYGYGYRSVYLLICSVYEPESHSRPLKNIETGEVRRYSKHYIGFFKNFIPFYTYEAIDASEWDNFHE
jgi:hypothetical protein